MPQVTISDDVFQRALAFKPLVESVIEVKLESDGYIELLLRMAPDLLLGEFFGVADAKTLLRLLQQIGNQHPETYAALAEVLEQDEDHAIEVERRTEVKQRLGFPEPDR
jgi:hypothetical protein